MVEFVEEFYCMDCFYPDPQELLTLLPSALLVCSHTGYFLYTFLFQLDAA